MTCTPRRGSSYRGCKLRAAPVRWLGSAEVDNLTVRPVAGRYAGRPQYRWLGSCWPVTSSTVGLGAQWSWVRPDAAAVVADGKLSWPLQNADLVGSGNNAGLLFHQTPAGDSWIAETKLHLDLGEGDIRNYQQAGMIAYLNDDDFARLGDVSIWRTRQTEFGRELVARAVGRRDQLRRCRDRPAGGDHVDAARLPPQCRG